MLARTDYQVSYKNNKKVGIATVIVTFGNHYAGTVEKSFTIQPKATAIQSIKAKKKNFTLKWKKQTAEITGYEIQYGTNKKFTKSATKTVLVKKNKTTQKTIKRLKSKKTYYVRVRTYKSVKVNGKTKKIYSAWSKVKKIKVK